jgi:hypothetical protein
VTGTFLKQFQSFSYVVSSQKMFDRSKKREVAENPESLLQRLLSKPLKTLAGIHATRWLLSACLHLDVSTRRVGTLSPFHLSNKCRAVAGGEQACRKSAAMAATRQRVAYSVFVGEIAPSL